MKKQIISLISIITLLLSVCVVAYADNETETKGDFVYIKGTNKITQYIGTSGICELPEGVEVMGLQKPSSEEAPITKLIINKDVTFTLSLSGEVQKFDSLKEVIIKDGVKEIPDNAFESCNALEKIAIPSTVTEIGEGAFSQCKSLKTIEFAEGLTTINDFAFGNLPSLTGDIIIPDTVTNMGYGVFSHCGDLDKVHISDNATYGRDGLADWFYYTNIKEINIPDAVLENPVCEFNADKITFNSDMTVAIYNAVKNSDWYRNTYLKENADKNGFDIAENTVLRYIGADRNPSVPDGVMAIAFNAFAYTDIDTVNLPGTLEEIDGAAFYCSTIKNIEIPAKVKRIDDNAFDWCPFLEKITFDGTPDIGGNGVVLTNTLKEDNIIFKNGEGKTKQQILDNGTNEYGMDAFYRMLNSNREALGMDEVTIPDNAKTTPEPREKTQPTPLDKEEKDNPKATEKPIKTLTVNSDMSVRVDSTTVDFPDAKPFIDDNDRTQIPIRAVAEMLDCTVDWNGKTKTVTITNNDGDIVTITVGSDVLTKNNETIQMDTTAMIKDERTYIPIRFVAETMGLTVDWVK